MPHNATRSGPDQSRASTVRVDLLLLDRLEDFDDAWLVVRYVDALEDLAVLAAPNLSHDLIIVLFAVKLR